MATTILGLDIGGANLKAATPDKRAASVPFALWKQPDRLPAALAELVAQFPDAEELAVTMTGELCDCFETKREGVAAIIKAVRFASAARPIHVWSTDGCFLNSEEAKQNHMKVAAANWHALATFAGRFAPRDGAILVDVGSTTTDVIPILDGKPVPEGRTDYQRLLSRELVYTGVRRTPICAVVPWLVAAELFATTLDAYLMLGFTPEDPSDCDTADGRPATRKHAHARLARMYCADTDTLSEEDIRTLAEGILSAQTGQVQECIAHVNDRLRLLHREGLRQREEPRWGFERLMFWRRPRDTRMAELAALLAEQVGVAYIVSGSGEFLAQRVIARPHDTSLSDQLGPEVSACAPAYAVAVLAAERRP